MTSIEQIKNWSEGTFASFYTDCSIQHLVIDSRKINQPEASLFIVLVSSRRDGHDFIVNAYEKGVRNFLVSKRINASQFPNTNFILVKDTLAALHKIAVENRKQFSFPVVGITGSNGKTIVKEWLFQLLGSTFNLVRSPKSFNSQIGVPISVWLMKEEHNFAVFEAGISQKGEMEKLEKIVQPTIGIFTNIGEAHNEGFENHQEKIREKLLLFARTKQLIYCSDNAAIQNEVAQLKHRNKDLELFDWSFHHQATLEVKEVETVSRNKTIIKAKYQANTISIEIPFSDKASIENAIHCWCLLLMLGNEQKVIQQKMVDLHPVAMRLQLRKGINECTVIDDAYNADLTSLQIALDYLEQQTQHEHKTVILSDLLQFGKSDEELYKQVAALMDGKNIQRFIGVGNSLYANRVLFKKNKKRHTAFYKTTSDLLKNVPKLSFEHEAILLKGSRSFEFERLRLLLEQNVHQTVLSINLSSLVHNLNVFRGLLNPSVKVMAMVKAFSYGSGSHEIAHVLQYAGVDYLTVAYTDEGVALRKAGIHLPIMVMSPDLDSFDRMIAWKLEPELYNLRSVHAFMKIAETMQVKNYLVHIKLDTGMHRLGFEEKDIEALGEIICSSNTMKVASIFSHLAASEDAAYDDFTKQQADRLVNISLKLKKIIGGKPMLHLCNSAGIARHKELHFDMVRLGLGLYGIDGSGVLQNQLQQIGTLKTTIAQIREVKKGETISYGRKAVMEKTTRIATISIGYADGYPRALGNGVGYVLINGKKAQLIGTVCMDMCMVDITNIPEAQEGDEVTVFGQELPLTDIAQWSSTISYEIMTGISQRVKRVYVNEE
jgi:alanine racemase